MSAMYTIAVIFSHLKMFYNLHLGLWFILRQRLQIVLSMDWVSLFYIGTFSIWALLNCFCGFVKCELQRCCGPFWILFCFIDLCVHLSSIPHGLEHCGFEQTLDSSAVSFPIFTSFSTLFWLSLFLCLSTKELWEFEQNCVVLSLYLGRTDSLTMLSLAVHEHSVCPMCLDHFDDFYQHL